MKKIMFVDDDKFLMDMYSTKFSKAGYEVKAADSTETALKILRDSYVPDIMLVDVVMPGMDGLDLVAAVRREKLAPGAIIIMLSNQGASEDIERAKKLGVESYIVKATTIPSDVLKEVEEILANKKP
ncbi:response regulator [Patescibacteria group bacterium]|nr:response regulator [Patescibacteria group bacterium]MDE1946758.1 response regulator [Patescibacteria group bacterium]MDE2010939.1 response regulator [Patescibacteria group bacterium]MDE2233656.1 response regulator [Patescibacteria group bacterium]